MPMSRRTPRRRADRWEVLATRTLNEDGTWKDLMADFNTRPTSARREASTTVGRTGPSDKVFKAMPELAESMSTFTNGGDEIAVGTIGDASTSEGLFWESMNAACVLEVPMLMSVWDDGYGISVPKKYQTVKESISAALSGFQREEASNGLVMYRVKGWDTQLVATYERRPNGAGEATFQSWFTWRKSPAQGTARRDPTSGTSGRASGWAAEYVAFDKWGSSSEGRCGHPEELDALRKEAKKTFAPNKNRLGCIQGRHR